MKPDYKNCQMNLIQTIENHYGNKIQYFESIKELDEKIKDKKHVFLILLDGLGTKIIEKHLNETSFIRNHYFRTISTLFPPTTACVTTAIQSGKLPNDTGYYGWHQYFKEFNREVVLFKNEDYYTGERLNMKLPISYKRFFESYENVSTFILYPKWDIERGYKNFRAQVDKMIAISENREDTFTYAYFDEIDEAVHKYGTDSKKIRKIIEEVDKDLSYLQKHLKKDSIVFLTADHGLIDCKTIYLEDYPDVIDLLELKPSIEARCTTFKVSNPERFRKLFDHYFPIGFELYTKDEFLKTDYVYHTNTEYRFEEYLFDFVAVANDRFCFMLQHTQGAMKAAHAGATVDEMLVPLVVFEEKKE